MDSFTNINKPNYHLRWLGEALIVSTMSMVGSLAVAETSVKESATLTDAVEPIAISNLLQLSMGLIVVLIVIVGIAWLVRRIGKFQATAGGSLRVLGGLSMGTRERVVLIQVGEKQLLLGVAPGRVQTLHVLENALPDTSQDSGTRHSFAENLSIVLSKGKRS